MRSGLIYQHLTRYQIQQAEKNRQSRETKEQHGEDAGERRKKNENTTIKHKSSTNTAMAKTAGPCSHPTDRCAATVTYMAEAKNIRAHSTHEDGRSQFW